LNATSNATETFTLIKEADEKKYIMALGTYGTSDSSYNECMLPEAHAFSLISAFEMSNSTDTFKMYMIRNPWGKSRYNLTWS